MYVRPLIVSLCAILSGAVGTAEAGSVQLATASQTVPVEISRPDQEPYRGYVVDLSEVKNRPDLEKLVSALKHQIDIVEGVGLSDRVLKFFRTVPILVDEEACLHMPEKNETLRAASCFNPNRLGMPSGRQSFGSVWDSTKAQWTNEDPIALALDTGIGVVAIRPATLSPSSPRLQDPVLLHELLHAYHHNILPMGEDNPAIDAFFKAGKSKYPSKAYLGANDDEFFAVTASAFLYGADHDDAFANGKFTRADLKEKQPDYYAYLVWLFGLDPQHEPPSAPVASAR